MKKIMCLVLAFLMVVSSITTFADSSMSNGVKTALAKVKSVVAIPEELTEFTSNSNTYQGKTSYSFNWRNKEDTSYFSVECDSEGRISYIYQHTNDRVEDKFTEFTTDDYIKFANEFMNKTFPDAFADENDCLVIDYDSKYSFVSSDTSYRYFNYKRIKDGATVLGDRGSIGICVSNGKMYFENASVSFNFDGKFEKAKTEIDNVRKIYQEEFPAELLYQKKYTYVPYNKENNNEIKLIYRINNPGYISAYTGKVVEQEQYDYAAGAAKSMVTDEVAEDSVSLNSVNFTEEELKELDQVSGLKSVEELEAILKKLPSVKFNKQLNLYSQSVSHIKDDYFIRLSYSNEDKKSSQYFNVKFDAKEGKLLSLNNNQYFLNDKGYSSVFSINEKQKRIIINAIEKFAKAVVPEEFAQCREQNEYVNYPYITKEYNRYVNGIRYENNGINITYNNKMGEISNYNLSYDKDEEFVDPSGILTIENAYEKMLNISPLEKVYVNIDDEYKLCYYHDNSLYGKVDAFTGEPITYDDPSVKEFEYNDISGHWAENAINKLAQIGIGIYGNSFEPDKEITQKELLRMLSCAVYYTDYMNYEYDELYRSMYNYGIITSEERNDNGNILREDAFVYLIKMMDLERVAKLSDIFKVVYADQDMITPEKIGYASILSGMKIIGGDGSAIAPKDNMKRAEAAQMIYNYLSVNK